jgi:hypothetical protein
VLIAIPLLTVIACGVTLWLALTHPDPLVVEDGEYRRIRGDLRAQGQPEAGQVREPDPEKDPSTTEDD